MTVRPAVVLLRNDAVLLMQYRYGDTDVFALPGGNPDPGEDLEATLERELMEELGIEIQVFNMLFCGVVTRPNQKEDVLHCVFFGELFSGEPTLNPVHTTAKSVLWKPVDELTDLAMYPSVAAAIQEHHTAMLPTTYLGYIEQPFYS
ncbi:NUDIX hydrolase [Fibrella forsythiae]|uniref:NUDIX hydrolase n=1 Tax=Fibrella forsythiae TaxID=2817061 RepID=A0ABS3JIE3_9BACT|nr:NUDIX hydrolase [Fibrella forsythiae]MBO0949745.1 NUDIX hydrolase [Fibrella forsythiae]